jgi:hypothetical protein
MKYGIHVSDLRTYLTCRRKWDWSSLLRQGLEKKVTYAPFFTGRGIHYCLQQYYETGEHPVVFLPGFIEQELEAMGEAGELWDEEREIIETQTALMSAMLDHYYIWTRGSLQGLWIDDNLNFLALETEFNVPLRAPSGRASSRIDLEGRFDGIVQRKDNGTYWIWEVKTARSISQLVSTLDNDLQAGVYCLAAQELLGIPISGILYNIMRKKAPAQPRVLQNGMLSRAANIDTTPHYYLKAINEHHSEILAEWDEQEQGSWITYEYGEILNSLIVKQSEKPFFERVAIRRTQRELESLAKQVHYIGLEMVRPSTVIYPNPAWNTCTFCSFKAPCLAMNAGADIEPIMEAEYRPRRIWDPLEATEQGG